MGTATEVGGVIVVIGEGTFWIQPQKRGYSTVIGEGTFWVHPQRERVCL